MGGPERDTEIEAAAQAIKDAGSDDAGDDAATDPAEEPEPVDGVEKGDTPGAGSVHAANADGVQPD